MKTLTAIAATLTLFASLSQAAEIQLDPNLTLLSHNGEAHTQYGGELGLAAGKQVLELRYDAIFQLSAEDHESVRSPAFYLVFDASDEGQYQLSWPEVNTLSDAKKRAAEPVVTLSNAEGEAIPFELQSHDQLIYQLLLSQTR